MMFPPAALLLGFIMSLFVLAFALLLSVLIWFLLTDEDDPNKLRTIDAPARLARRPRTSLPVNRQAHPSIPTGG